MYDNQTADVANIEHLPCITDDSVDLLDLMGSNSNPAYELYDIQKANPDKSPKAVKKPTRPPPPPPPTAVEKDKGQTHHQTTVHDIYAVPDKHKNKTAIAKPETQPNKPDGTSTDTNDIPPVSEFTADGKPMVAIRPIVRDSDLESDLDLDHRLDNDLDHDLDSEEEVPYYNMVSIPRVGSDDDGADDVEIEDNVLYNS